MSAASELFLWMAKASGPARLCTRLRRETDALRHAGNKRSLAWLGHARFPASVTGDALAALANSRLEAHLPEDEPPASDHQDAVRAARALTSAAPGVPAETAGWTDAAGGAALIRRGRQSSAGSQSRGSQRIQSPGAVGQLERLLAKYFDAAASQAAPSKALASTPAVSPAPAQPDFMLGEPAGRRPFSPKRTAADLAQGRPERTAQAVDRQISDQLQSFASGTPLAGNPSRSNWATPSPEAGEAQQVFHVHFYPQADGMAVLEGLPDQMADILRAQALQHGIDLT